MSRCHCFIIHQQREEGSFLRIIGYDDPAIIWSFPPASHVLGKWRLSISYATESLIQARTLYRLIRILPLRFARRFCPLSTARVECPCI